MSNHYGKILVAVDDSAEAELGVKKAIAIAKQHRAELVLVHVVDIRAYTIVDRGNVAYRSQVTVQRRQLLNAYRSTCLHEGISQCKAELAFGNPRTVIVKQMVHRHQPDLIILGAAPMNKVKKWLNGSVEHRISKNAPCDVLNVQSG